MGGDSRSGGSIVHQRGSALWPSGERGGNPLIFTDSDSSARCTTDVSYPERDTPARRYTSPGQLALWLAVTESDPAGENAPTQFQRLPADCGVGRTHHASRPSGRCAQPTPPALPTAADVHVRRATAGIHAAYTYTRARWHHSGSNDQRRKASIPTYAGNGT